MPLPPSPLRVSAVVPTLGRVSSLGLTLDTLAADPAVAETVVVDDRPDAGTAPLPGTVGRPGVVVLRTGSAGPAAARRAGVEHASGDVVLLLDDDVVPDPGLASGHAAAHAEAPGLVVAGPMPVAATRRVPVPVRLYAQDYGRWRARQEGPDGDVLLGLWGGNVSLRREDALRIGLVSPVFAGRRHEDQEFGLRCRAAGLHGVWDPSLTAVHYYERSLPAFLADARTQGTERSVLHALHADQLGPARPEAYLDGLPAPLRAIVAVARRPRGATALRRGLLPLTRVPPLELLAVQVLRRVEQLDGAARPALGRATR